MQGFERMDRELLDAAGLVGHLVREGSMFAFLARHRAEVFPDAGYADLFCPDRGRPSVPATQMAAVMTLQTLHDYSDRETAEAVRFDVRWKVAIGSALDDEGFDPSTLVYWRRRLAKSGRPHRVNDAVKKIVEETGILKGRRRRAVDSTILADGVATQDTITQLVSAVRRVAREVPGAAGQIAEVCTGHDYSRPGKPKIDWDDPQAKEALVSALVNDANALVAALKDAQLEEEAAAALALLALVAGQDVEPAEGSDGRDGRWRIARKVAGDRPVDRTNSPFSCDLPREEVRTEQASSLLIWRTEMPWNRVRFSSGMWRRWLLPGPDRSGQRAIPRCRGWSPMRPASRSRLAAGSCATSWPAATALHRAGPTAMTCCGGSGSWPRSAFRGIRRRGPMSATSSCGCAWPATPPATGTARARPGRER